MELSESLRTSLRSEIVEAQKLGADFLKWKLIGIAAVASVALGLDKAGGDHPLLLCLIPLICAYTDIINLDLVTRIAVIAAYMRRGNDSYELFVADLRGSSRNPFKAGLVTIYLSSGVVDFLILVVGWATCQALNMAAGLAGICITVALWNIHAARVARIARRAKELALP
jgi:hypothetical protein